MTKLDDSAVEITLEGKTRELIATPKAMLTISRFSGGFGEVFERLRKQDVDIYILLVTVGLNEQLSDEEAAALIFNSGGMNALFKPLLEYAVRLNNGGVVPNEKKPKKKASS